MTDSNRCPDLLQADPLRALRGHCAEAPHARVEAARRSGLAVSIAVHRFVHRSHAGRAPGERAREGRAIAFAVALALLCAPNAGLARTPIADEGIDSGEPAPRTGVGWRVRGGAIHSLDAGLDAGGAFDTTRAVLEGSVR